MGLNEKFVTGRLRRRVLRAPVIDGWAADERGDRSPVRVAARLERRGDVGYAVRVPGTTHDARLGPAAAEWIDDGGDLEVTVGAPEPLVVLRRAGAVVYGEGDPPHFGPLPLDAVYTLRRTGFAYLDDHGVEVAVGIEIDEGAHVHSAWLDPGATVRIGPYRVDHDRSFDPADRDSVVDHHSYGLRVCRDRTAPVATSPHTDMPHPLDVVDAADVVAIARRFGALDADETLAVESARLARQLGSYEGAAGRLEAALRAVGPEPASFRRLAETVQVVSAYVARGDRGEPVVGRATVLLQPTRTIRVSRLPVDSVPGRLRRLSTAG